MAHFQLILCTGCADFNFRTTLLACGVAQSAAPKGTGTVMGVTQDAWHGAGPGQSGTCLRVHACTRVFCSHVYNQVENPSTPEIFFNLKGKYFSFWKKI